MKETYAKEIEKSLELKQAWIPYNECSSVGFDPNDSQIAPPGTRCFIWSFRIPQHQLCCFDRTQNKLSHLAEALWIAKTLAIGTRGKSIDTLAIPVIVDLRKYVDTKRINNSCLNNVGSVMLSVKTSPDMLLSDVAKRFRLDLARHEKNLSPFYASTFNMFSPVTPYHFYGCSSNIGRIELKPPLKDCYISARSHRFDIPNQLFLPTFSRVTPFRSDLVLQVRFAPSAVRVKDARIIADSIIYCLTSIPLQKTVREAHQELEAFQERLDNEY
jgi:hypothetical protein